MAEEVEKAKTEGYDLYIMRHGIPVSRGALSVGDDAKRPLTPEGKVKMQAIAKGLVESGVAIDWVVSSPLVRAAETAGIVSDVLEGTVPTDFCDALQPGGSPDGLIAFLAKHPQRKHVLVVGHEPDLSEMAARLIGAGRNARLGFKKGGCCLIHFEEFPPTAHGELVWWLTPKLMRKLAK